MDYKLVGCFVVLAIAGAIAQHEHHNHKLVPVSVYYESLCPDSKAFITKQLYPSLQGNLSKFVNLTLIPYGKARKMGDNFICHHGPAECEGNKLHACALRMIDEGNNTQGLGYNKVALGFINCLMNKAVRNGDTATFSQTECAGLNQVNNLNIIDNCVRHADGKRFFEEYGKMTDNLMTLVSVPTVVFENNYKMPDSDLAQTDFAKALCQYIHVDRPAECSESGASAVNFSLLFLVPAFLVARYLY